MNIKNIYSGGRFYTMFLATASAMNHKVYYISNVKPIFTKDFETYESYKNIEFIINDKFNISSDIKLDVSILIPDLGTDVTWFRKFYLNIIKKSYKDNGKILFLNFETPNWYNEVSQNKKDLKMWKYWLLSSNFCDAILSSADISTKYAKDFFINSDLKYFRCYPSINQKVADIYKDKVEKKDEIIIFARFFDKHKGSYEILDILTDKLSGFTIKIVVGNGDIPVHFKEELYLKSLKFDIKIKYLFKITDKEKFKEIASSKLLLFLSDFEGFGSPPVEALYMKVPVLAKYLDVLYEVSGDNITYAKRNNFKDIDLTEIIEKNVDYNKNIEFSIYAENLNSILKKVSNLKLKKTLLKMIELIIIDKKYFLLEKLKSIKIYFKSKYVAYLFTSKSNLVASSNNVIIYGIGEYAEYWTKWCEDNNKNIIAYIDSKKQNDKKFLNKKILLPSLIYEYEYDLLILASINGGSAISMIESFSNPIDIKKTIFTPKLKSLKKEFYIKKIVKDSLELLFVKKFGL